MWEESEECGFSVMFYTRLSKEKALPSRGGGAGVAAEKGTNGSVVRRKGSRIRQGGLNPVS